ncbi:hypothetical protein ACB092_09G169400 [Castanea dentata]
MVTWVFFWLQNLIILALPAVCYYKPHCMLTDGRISPFSVAYWKLLAVADSLNLHWTRILGFNNKAPSTQSSSIIKLNFGI